MKKDNFVLSILILLCIMCISINTYPQDKNGWSVKVLYSSEKTVHVYREPSLKSEITGSYDYLEKCLVVLNSSTPANFGWHYTIYPKKGFVEDKYLIENSGAGITAEQAGWKWEIMYCTTPHLFVKAHPDYKSSVVGVIEKNEQLLTIKEERDRNKIWSRIFYPVEGYVLTEELTPNTGRFILGIGGSYGFKHIPYEKNLSNYKNPYGGFLEFTKTNWILNFRFGFKYSEANIAQWVLKTQLLYSQIQLKLIRLFDNHIETYAFAGGGYWMASLQNMKYSSGSFSSYYPENKDKGLAYLGGGGIGFNSFGFFVDVQYLFFGSMEAVFGKEPSPGEFTNQYKLYPGANQFNVMLGYKFIF